MSKEETMRRGIAIALSVLLVLGLLPSSFLRATAEEEHLPATCIFWSEPEMWGVKENITSDNWSEGCYTSAEKPEVILDLGESKVIDKIKIWPSEASAVLYAEDYQFLVSTDGTEYQSVLSVTGDVNSATERIYEFASTNAACGAYAVRLDRPDFVCGGNDFGERLRTVGRNV